ncbi:MAG: AAA family ATPase, partial [Syntrophobacteraceae bacterium]
RDGVYVSDKVLEYLLNIVEATRTSPYLSAGLSTRGALALANTSKSDAFMRGRDFVVPENVKAVADHVICHRVIFRDEFEAASQKEIIRSLLEKVRVPA